MDADNKAASMEYLKQMVLQQIQSQEQTQKILKKIFRRISVFYITISSVILIGIMFLIYIESRPDSKAAEALKAMDSLNTRISLQRQYIEMDRKDLEDTRKEVQELIKKPEIQKKVTF